MADRALPRRRRRCCSHRRRPRRRLPVHLRLQSQRQLGHVPAVPVGRWRVGRRHQRYQLHQGLCQPGLWRGGAQPHRPHDPRQWRYRVLDRRRQRPGRLDHGWISQLADEGPRRGCSADDLELWRPRRAEGVRPRRHHLPRPLPLRGRPGSTPGCRRHRHRSRRHTRRESERFREHR